MTVLEDELRAALRAHAQTIPVPERPVLDRAVVEVPRRGGARWLIAAACLVLVAAAVVALAQRRGDPEPGPPVDSVSDTSAPIKNGWVAVDAARTGGNSIYLVRDGEEARRLEVAGSGTADDECPAWSPDGKRLMFGRLTESAGASLGEAELVIVPVGSDGATGAPTVIALDGFAALDGFDAHPCAIWSPDGRWAALAGTGDVWVVDTRSGTIRRLPGLRPSDLEWRPGTDELTIAGDMGTDRAAPTLSTAVSVYSVSTGELRQLGSIAAAFITWSPDGSTLAYEGGEDDSPELWLVDADGANQRLLSHGGAALGGVGPVWSPTGDRVAYQRICDAVPGRPPGSGCGERHEVVLVSVADGTETVIAPPETARPVGPQRWYPFTVTWSPDGTTLVYTAWSDGDSLGVLAVPADKPSEVTVLTDEIAPVASYYSHRWSPVQMWGRQPG